MALAVVTGASAGIGAATARRLGGDGWHVVLVARRPARLAEVARDVELAGGRASVEALDGGDADAVLAMAERVLADHGAPDAVVNAAGHGEWARIEDTPPAQMDAMLDAPFRSAYHHTHAFMRPMLDADRGVVVHVGSPAAWLPWPGATAYACSRWALRGLHEALCQDLAGTGVHSCHVVFGEVSSDYWETNPSAAASRPGIGRVLPTISPARCGDVIAGVLADPRRELFAPPAVRLAMGAGRAVPPLGRWLLRATARPRPSRQNRTGSR